MQLLTSFQLQGTITGMSICMTFIQCPVSPKIYCWYCCEFLEI